MRNMAFSFTLSQMYAGTKSVTRRIGWKFLKPGDIVMAIEKGMGLKKGEHVKQIYPIEIISTREEMLMDITREDVIKEGYPNPDTDAFIEVFMATHSGCDWFTLVNRIEFKQWRGENQ